MRHIKIILLYILLSFTSTLQDTAHIKELLKIRRDMKHNDFNKEVTDPNFPTFALNFIDFIEKFQSIDVQNIDAIYNYSYQNRLKQAIELFKEQSSNKLKANQEPFALIELDFSSVNFLNECFKYCFVYIYHNHPDVYTHTIYRKSVGEYYSLSDIYFAELVYFMFYVYVYKEVFINDKNFTGVLNSPKNTWLSELNFFIIMPYVMWFIYPDIKTKFLLQNNTSNYMSLNG